MADGTLDLGTPHFDRDRNTPVGRIPAGVARGFVNNEPIGPQSSVESDEDPARLAEAARATWRMGGAGYTLHTGAGIRGGGAFDRARGRSANLFDVPGITRILAAIRAARAEESRDVAGDRPRALAGRAHTRHPCEACAADDLLAGPAGVGKFTTALAIAQAVNCLDVRDGAPCGACNVCTRIARGQFSDVIVVYQPRFALH